MVRYTNDWMFYTRGGDLVLDGVDQTATRNTWIQDRARETGIG